MRRDACMDIPTLDFSPRWNIRYGKLIHRS
jgi:hypothetical protein